MKWIFYVVVFIYMFYRAVYGLKTIPKESRGLSIEQIDYGIDKTYFEVGARKAVTCKAASKNQKVEWVDPSGIIVQRVPTNRVFAQENFVPYLRNRIPALVLTFNHIAVGDTGVWECRSGDLKQEVSLCIIEPSVFVDTPTVVRVERGRSITLTCQAKGEPEPRLSWYRNGEVITDQSIETKYHVMTKYNSQGFESLLTITDLEPEDGGEYICDAIQESPRLEDCTASTNFNITLHVKYAPIFADGNDTAYVASMENERVQLTCSAEGYPEPAYKWYTEISDTEDTEHTKDDIKYEEKSAILTLVANASTFGQRYKCKASNQYGDMYKYFVVVKLEKPKKPNELSVENSTHNALSLNVKWNSDVYSTVDEIFVQYMEMEILMKKKVAIPREIDWKKAQGITIKSNEGYESIDGDKAGLVFTVPDLEEETEYWIRLKAINGAGESPWSDPILASTVVKPEEVVMVTEPSKDDNNEEAVASAQVSDSTFYGIFFTGGIIVVAIGCMFAMRLV